MLKSKLAFDIGANVGKCTELLLNKYEKVIAVEPIKLHYELLKNKFINQNVELINAVVSADRENKLFFECDTISTLEKDWVLNSRFSNNYVWKNPIQINSITIDDIIDQYGIPDFIKIDVEGHELEVITGFLKNCKPLIAFEWAEEFLEKTKECINILNKKSYNKFSICHLNDDINYSPDWISYKDVLQKIESMKSEKNNYHWGMIWAV
jgi:FkbM family methyltransferase